jgi:hypothetical protein
MTPDAVIRAIMAAGLPFDQIIREFSDPVDGGGWTHISVQNDIGGFARRQALIIDKLGTRAFA